MHTRNVFSLQNMYVHRSGEKVNIIISSVLINISSTIAFTQCHFVYRLLFGTSFYLLIVGDDYLTRTQTLTFLPNQFITTVQVQIVDDNTAEPIENFFGDLSNPVGRVDIFEPGAIVDIIDNDSKFPFIVAFHVYVVSKAYSS